MATRDLWRTRGYNEPRYNNDYNYDRHYQNNYPRSHYQRTSYRDESNYRADRHSNNNNNTHHYPRYDYKGSYYFQRHRSHDRTRRTSHRASHHRTRSPGATNYTRHERRYSRDYRRSPNTQRAPSVRTESRVDSRYADHHDSEGHVLVNLGGDLTSRYKQLAVVGEGTFGKVLECWDRETREHVAVKVIRAVPKYRDAAMIEIRIFDQLHAIDPQHKSGIIHLKGWFDYCNHVCMVFPLCGASLFDYMRNNQFQPLHLPVIRCIARQLFTSLAALHKHGIIHTDLKPENLLFRDTRMTPVNVESRLAYEWGPVKIDTCQSPLSVTEALNPELVVVDFGSAVARTDHRSRVVGTRHYRAPEVMWEAHRTGDKKHDNVTWGQEVDIWAAGCILIELWMGDPLFRTRHNHDHLLMMQRVLGAFPSHWVSRDQQRRFDQDRDLYSHLQSLDKLLVVDDEPLTLEFFRLIRATLEYDPARRITAAQALDHAFFAQHVDYPLYFRRVLQQQAVQSRDQIVA